MLRHYQQTYYSRQQQQQQQTTQQQITTQEQIKQQQRDLRISSFQQITPPESLAFWQQQQQLTAQNMSCRSVCCNTQVPTGTTTALDQRYAHVNKYSPPCPYALFVATPCPQHPWWTPVLQQTHLVWAVLKANVNKLQWQMLKQPPAQEKFSTGIMRSL